MAGINHWKMSGRLNAEGYVEMEESEMRGEAWEVKIKKERKAMKENSKSGYTNVRGRRKV